MCRVVLANDLSASACEAMRMNVAYNDAGKSAKSAVDELSPEEQAMNAENGGSEEAENGASSESSSRRRPGCEGFVHVNENDAWYVPKLISYSDDRLMKQYAHV
jgi:tRNA (guanine26-N2/guanine27-N2)-dimethyltransferase